MKTLCFAGGSLQKLKILGQGVCCRNQEGRSFAPDRHGKSRRPAETQGVGMGGQASDLEIVGRASNFNGIRG